MELTDLTLPDASRMLRQREISPVELAQASLERVQRLDGRLNAYITVTAEEALAAARQSEARWINSAPLSPLDGIPLALKDLYETRGVRTTAGSKVFADYVPQADAALVDILRHAGALFLGKVNMHEIALGVTNVNPHYGPCRNPWDQERVSGGSSGGSAVALAAGFCLGALGSDTGGSIRIPASLCGVVGLKPTYGRCSLRGVIPLSWNLDHAGPLARTVAGAAMLLQVMAGYDPADPASVDMPVGDYLAGLPASANIGLRGKRIAMGVGKFFAHADPLVLQAVDAAARVLTQLGAQVEPVEIPGLLEMARANQVLVTADAAAFHHERLEQQPQDFGEDVRQRLASGAAVTSTEYALARRLQSEARRQLEQFFDNHDLLLVPGTPTPAPMIEGPNAVEQARVLTRFTAPFNLTGLPALALPCGFTPQGLPLGMQLVARPWDEANLLQVAHAYEQAAGWWQRQPDLSSL